MTNLIQGFKHSLRFAAWAVLLGDAGNMADAIARAGQ